MISQSFDLFFPARAERSDPMPQRPAPGPVLMADILVSPGGRPSLLALWAAWEERLDK